MRIFDECNETHKINLKQTIMPHSKLTQWKACAVIGYTIQTDTVRWHTLIEINQ